METKKKYTVPAIEIILLDNEISLALESAAPPAGHGESFNIHTENPFKQDKCLV